MTLLKVLVTTILVVMAHGQEECEADGCTSNDVALKEAGSQQAANHFYIGGMFNIHEQGADAYTCGKTSLRGLINAEAFFWAIDEYSKRAGLTTDADPVRVGGFVMDNCGRVEKAIEDVYSFLTCRTQYTNVSPRNTVAMVGPANSAQSMATAKLLNDMKVTQVSSISTSPELSDNMYSYFLRTVPSDALQTIVMAKLMQYKSIRYVQVLYQDNAYGMGLFMAFKNAIKGDETDVCITVQSQFTTDAKGADRIKNMLGGPKATRFVVILGTNTAARFVLETVDADSDLKNEFVFVGTMSWGTDLETIAGLDSAEKAITFSFDTEKYSNKDDVQRFYDNLFLMEPDTGTNTGGASVNMYNPWFTKYWEEAFGCSFDAGTCNLANQRLEDKIDRSEPYVPFTLMAVDAIIRGVKAAAVGKCGDIHLCSNLLNPGESRGIDLYNYTMHATNMNGVRYFNDKGDASNLYSYLKVYQVKDGAYYNVLDYSNTTSTNYGFTQKASNALVTVASSCPHSPCLECGDEDITTTTEKATTTEAAEMTMAPLTQKDLVSLMIQHYFKEGQEFTGVWRDQEREDKDKKTRFENGFDWIIAIGVCAGLGVVCVLVFEIYILYKLMGTKIGKQWRTMWLGQLLLFGLFCSYLTLFAYLFTPTKATCGITRFGVGVSYAMCFAILLVKLMVLLTSKTSADTLLPGDVDSPNYLRGIYQFLMFIFVVGVQVVIAVQWLIQVPPDAIKVISNTGEQVWICNHYTWALEDGWENMTTFVRTDFENHLISLTYIMFLIVLTTIIAMKAHGIITNHRESVFIGIAAGFSIPVWVAWGLVGGLNKDNKYAQEFGDAATAFGLFITATIVLFAMFLPKVRQLVNMGVEGIYLEDDRDTYYAGSVVMAPPSYKSRPSSVVYVNSNGYNDPIMINDPNAVHLRHPGSNYSAPVYVKKPESLMGGSTGRVLRVTGDLTGKHPRENKKSMSEIGYVYAGSNYGGTLRKPRSESGGTMRRSLSEKDLGAL